MKVPFSPPPGINSDDTTFAAEGKWADGNNVRFVDGKPQVIGRIFENTSIDDTPTNPVTAFIYWVDAAGSLRGAVAADAKLYGGTQSWTDVTPTPAPTGNAPWILDLWGDDLLAIRRGGKLYTRVAAGGAATEIANAPDVINYMLVNLQRQVMAFGCNEEASGTFNGRCIRWSDVEDNTDWTTSSSNLAGEYILGGYSDIVAAKIIGPYVAVWTHAALWLGEFTGDVNAPWRFDKVAEGCGMGWERLSPAPRSVTVWNQRAYWLGMDKAFYSWAPGEIPQQIPCPILKEFQDNCHWPAQYINAFFHPVTKYGEIWYFYPDKRDDDGTPETNTRYLAYSVTESAKFQRPVWFRGQIARSAMADLNSEIRAIHPTTGATYTHEYATLTGSGLPTIDWHITSADQYIGNTPEQDMMVRSFITDFETQLASVSLTLTARQYPMSAATTKGPYTISTTTKKKDLRASGRLFTVKFSGSSAGELSDWRMGTPLFDVVGTGRR